jgi:hypothetical protein
MQHTTNLREVSDDFDGAGLDTLWLDCLLDHEHSHMGDAWHSTDPSALHDMESLVHYLNTHPPEDILKSDA